MSNYTFESLSDTDFEELVGDLLSAELRLRLQCFTKGRDLGIDLLAGPDLKKSLVVQCKHYVRSGFDKLLLVLETKDKPKLTMLSPIRYIIVTSVPLTPHRKSKLKTALAPYVESLEDIIGANELNALLRKHSDIETKHHKLWLTSSAVLSRVLNNAAAVWEHMQQTEIQRALSLYVQTDAYADALARLEKFNYCIISGMQGVGKTTLARVLTTRLMGDDVQVVYARDDIEQAFQMLNPERPQIVFYDDFLGRASLAERLKKNEDNSIISLLRRARQSKTLKVIFTTREYLLSDAKQRYDRLSGPELGLGECIIDLKSYTKPLRARMLYNHLYFSTLSISHKTALVANGFYKQIVDHPNFTPRLIEWMTLDDGGASVQPALYPAAVLKALEKPDLVWQPVFENQIDDADRALLLVLSSMPQRVSVESLEEAWQAYWMHCQRGINSGDVHRVFRRSLKALGGTFVSVTTNGETTAVEFSNPSIRDFVRQRIAVDRSLRETLIHTSLLFEQVHTLLLLGDNGRITTVPYSDIRLSAVTLQAIERTLTKTPGELHVYQQYGGGMGLYTASQDFGARLNAVMAWLTESWTDGPDAKMHGFIKQVLLESGSPAAIRSSGLEVVEYLWMIDAPNATEWEEDAKAVLAAVIRHLKRCNDIEEWSDFGGFIQRNSERFEEGELDALRSRAHDVCESEVDASYSPESVSDVEERIDQLKTYCEEWDFDIDDWLRRLESKRESAEERERGQEDAWDDDVPRTSTEGQSSYRDIDGWFASLLRE